MNKNQKWIALFVSFFLLTTGAFYAVWADHEEHKEWRWYEKIFDWDDDDDDDDDDNDHNRGKKGGDIKRGTGMIPSIMGSTI